MYTSESTFAFTQSMMAIARIIKATTSRALHTSDTWRYKPKVISCTFFFNLLIFSSIYNLISSNYFKASLMFMVALSCWGCASNLSVSKNYVFLSRTFLASNFSSAFSFFLCAILSFLASSSKANFIWDLILTTSNIQN